MIEEVSIPTREIEADGFITPPSALEHIEKPNTSMTGNATARPMRDCLYPKCEECDNYHGHYCTVPMVVSKQIYRETMERIGKIEKTLAELEKTVTEEIIGSKDTVRIDHDGWHKQVVAGEELWCPDGAHIEVHDGIRYWTPDEETNLTWSDYFRDNAK